MDRILTFKTIDNRIERNGVVDLTHQMVDVKQYPRIMTKVIVNDEFAGRLNLISKIHYGSEDHMDLLAHFNGISNPFDLQPDTIIIIPFLEDLQSFIIQEPSSIVDTVNNESNDRIVSKMNVRDPRRQIPDFVQQAAGGQLPNTTDPGTSNTMVDDGVIILGANGANGICNDNANTTTSRKTLRIRNAVIASINGNSNQ